MAKIDKINVNSTTYDIGADASNVEYSYGGSGTAVTVVDNVSDAVDELYDYKQDALVSGTNIKTVNGNSLLGSGDLTISGTAFSFVGMVVSGTNLTTEASVKALYGSGTSWSLISSVMLASEHVFGNGYITAMTDGSTLGGLRSRGDNAAPTLYGQLVGYTTQTGTLAAGGMGVPTKTELGSNPEYSGLIADTITVYSWERTA